ncbi:LPXTG cell wall anchor domain-containing protein [Streptomyces sp. CRN 30]|uniref:LPXTG cell wall anchor domain-containing protein n=1 Tax=Streptomyces sp. CRN 30 TaxID=3075613 RepID=UPI002A81E8CD|nr:LPXTG cell wall anchor domain-containing protein [Streptomyces sp. CRN 30]
MHRSGVRARRTGPAAFALASALVLTASPGATAAGASATGPEGQKLTVSKTSGLAEAGETVTVTGSGYNTEKGIYVAFCVDNGAGRTPTPCVGGVDMSGESGASVWVSSDPPSYGEGLAEPYEGSGKNGSFSVQVKVRAKDANTDCTKSGVTCAVITRNDHTRGGDQSQTVRVPVTFGDDSGAGSDAGPEAGTTGPSATASASAGSVVADGTDTTDDDGPSGPLASTGAGTALPVGLAAAGLVVVGGAGWLWARRRREAPAAGSTEAK